MNKAYTLLAALTVAACSPAEERDATSDDADSIQSVRLYALECGRIEISDLSMMAQDDIYKGRQLSGGTPCFLIRHPDGDLLWDAGMSDAIHDEVDGIDEGPLFHISVPITLASQMKILGLAPSDVEFLSVSHSHWDHVGNAAMFAGSTLIIDKKERDYMFRDEAREDAETFALVAALENAETIEIDGDHDVFGDGSVMILSTPGHTPGHTVLQVNLENAGTVLLSGDLYTMLEARERRSVPKFNVDVAQTLASMDRFETIAENTGARVIIQHSLEDLNALPKAPAYLD